MKIIVVLPDNNYFLWQMLVQITNFRKFDLENNLTYIIGKHTLQSSDILMNIMNSNINCNFHVYNDTRENPKYSSSLRPHILAKYFESYPEMENTPFFYIDPDVLFTKKIKFSDIENNNISYLSDTKSYIGSKYIKSKSDILFKEMCDIVNIEQSIVEKNDDSAGGAQYLLKNINVDFWKKVEKDSEKLFEHMINTSNKYAPKNPIQAWTADMWALLWNIWRNNGETKIIKRFDFAWATDSIKKWGDVNIYHNAGAVVDDETFFVKTKYQISPFNKKIKCSNKFCSFKYLEEVKETEKIFKSILF